MNSICSNSTISTTASLRCSISSKSMLRNSDSTSAFKASRNAKYKVNNRWRATTRREPSLTSLMKPKRASRNQIISNTSLSSNLGRGLQGLRLGSIGKFNNADFSKDAPFGEIYCSTISTNSDIKVMPPPICIKSAELNRALHRDIDLQMSSNPKEDKLHLKERWSAKSEKGGSPLYKPTRRNSRENLR